MNLLEDSERHTVSVKSLFVYDTGLGDIEVKHAGFFLNVFPFKHCDFWSFFLFVKFQGVLRWEVASWAFDAFREATSYYFQD